MIAIKTSCHESCDVLLRNLCLQVNFFDDIWHAASGVRETHSANTQPNTYHNIASMQERQAHTISTQTQAHMKEKKMVIRIKENTTG